MTSIDIIVPTLGSRPDFLEDCIEALRLSGANSIKLLIPETAKTELETYESDLVSIVLEDPQLTLGQNILKTMLSSRSEFVSWLGDDDLVDPQTYSIQAGKMRANDYIAACFVSCVYIDYFGNHLASSGAGQLAARLLKTGPNLLPQPGCLFRSIALHSVAQRLRSHLAFDYEIFLALTTVGSIRHVYGPKSYFRWHSDSLTVANRWTSALESSRVRGARRSFLKKMAFLPLEIIITLATWISGKVFGIYANYRGVLHKS